MERIINASTVYASASWYLVTPISNAFDRTLEPQLERRKL